MPAKSEKQRKLMGLVHAVQKGDAKAPNKKIANMANTMTTKSVKDYASTKEKGLPKTKKENKDGCLSEIYGVQKPYSGCDMSSLVIPIDPYQGLSQGQIGPDAMHGVYADKETAARMAEQLFQEFTQYEQKLEEKKGGVVKKIQTAISKLEKQRKEAMANVMASPKESSAHKERIAQLTTKIDDLVSKMERVSKSQKETADVESKEAETKKGKK